MKDPCSRAEARIWGLLFYECSSEQVFLNNFCWVPDSWQVLMKAGRTLKAVTSLNKEARLPKFHFLSANRISGQWTEILQMLWPQGKNSFQNLQMLYSLRDETEGKLQMPLSPRKYGLTSLFKEVRIFKEGRENSSKKFIQKRCVCFCWHFWVFASWFFCVYLCVCVCVCVLLVCFWEGLVWGSASLDRSLFGVCGVCFFMHCVRNVFLHLKEIRCVRGQCQYLWLALCLACSCSHCAFLVVVYFFIGLSGLWFCSMPCLFNVQFLDFFLMVLIWSRVLALEHFLKDYHRGQNDGKKYFSNKNALPHWIFEKITKQSLYKENSFACSLANRDKPVAATLQRKCSGGIIL